MKKLATVALTIVSVLLSAVLLAGCGGSSRMVPCPVCGKETSSWTVAEQGVCDSCYEWAEEENRKARDFAKNFESNRNQQYRNQTIPSYADPRWPTNNSQLLAIPDYQRWYNAWASAGTYCTITGPVVNVYQAKESYGMPIFIDIGASYPSGESVSMVIWGDQYYDFAQMINDVDDGGAWLSVTGYLSVYNGRLQFDAGEGYLEYMWWTHVS